MTPADIAAWLALAPVIMQLIDYIVSVIEKLFPKKTGAEKKDVAMKLAKAMVPSLETGEAVPDGYLSKLIDNQVALNNQAGVFDHAKPGVFNVNPVSIYAG